MLDGMMDAYEKSHPGVELARDVEDTPEAASFAAFCDEEEGNG